MSAIRPSPPTGTSYSTSFGATENPVSESTKWLNGLTDGLDWNDVQTTPGKAFAAAYDTFPGGVADGTAQLKRSYLACTANQYAEATCFRTANYDAGGTHEIEVFVHMTITANSITGYECYVNYGGNHNLVRWNGPRNDYTILASNNVSTFTAPVDGDVIRVECVGDVISCYQNGTLRTTATDTTYRAGNPGMGNNVVSGVGSALDGIGWASYRCGNL